MPTRASTSSPGPERPRRRQRTSSPSAAAAPGRVWTKSASWDAYGDLLLEAEDTGFRVYKGHVAKAKGLEGALDLASQSDVAGERYGDLLSAEEKRLSVLPMVLDRASDVEAFVKALNDPTWMIETGDGPCPDVLELRALLVLADKYDHSDIRVKGLKLFRTRVANHRRIYFDAYPQAHPAHASDGVPAQKRSDTWDNTFFDGLGSSVMSLIAMATEAHLDLDVKDELSSLYSLLAGFRPRPRTDQMFREIDAAGWQITLSRQALKEISSRIDRTYVALDRARTSLALYSKDHTRTCPDGNRRCQSLMSAFLLSDAVRPLFGVERSMRDSVECLLRAVQYQSGQNVPTEGTIRWDCVVALREWGWKLLEEYDAEMAIPAPAPALVASEPDA